jgi:hypothetical protein
MTAGSFAQSNGSEVVGLLYVFHLHHPHFSAPFRLQSGRRSLFGEPGKARLVLVD